MDTYQENAIAVIGMSGRFPKSQNLETFWNNLTEGKELISFFDDAAQSTDEEHSHAKYVKAKGILEDAQCFDAPFFNYSTREAELIDPQQRVLLECAWHAMENAGYGSCEEPLHAGVFVGSSISTYLLLNILPSLLQGKKIQDPHNQALAIIGNDKDFLATRISYKLNLTGPSKTVQTACSTSLVAVHDACQNLLDYTCDVALAGGVSITCPLQSGYLYTKEGITSPDGHCRAFDKEANGTLSGNGAAIVVLKRLECALNARDTIHGIILGSAINNDGHRKLGFTTPSIEGQSQVISEAISMANIEPDTISYVEAHGTGTQIGDPIEMTALTKAYRTKTAKNQFCALGSVKTNIGHLDAAAGVAGLIKVLLSMKNETIPKTLHYRTANPKLNIENSPFYIADETKKWERGHTPLRAGISSFGIGGTNVHMILEEGMSASKTPPSPAHAQLVTISAMSEESLSQVRNRLLHFLVQNPDSSLQDVAYTLNQGRKTLDYRDTYVCDTIESLISQLQAPNHKKEHKKNSRPLFWRFTSAHSIDSPFSIFRQFSPMIKEVENCFSAFASISQHPIEKLKTDRVVCSFISQYLMALFYKKIGLEPEGCIVCGIGTLAAAVIASIMRFEDAVALICANQSSRPIPPVDLKLSTMPLFQSDNTPLSSEQINDNAYWRGVFCETLNTLDSSNNPQIDALIIHFGAENHCNDQVYSEKTLLNSVGNLWKVGFSIRWSSFYECSLARKIPLPTYPFAKIPYWIAAPLETQPPPSNSQEKGRTETITSVMSGIKAIWQKALKNDNISVADSFFSLGGDSLLALDIKDSIKETFFVDVPLEQFFTTPTIEKLSEYVESQLYANLDHLSEKQAERILALLGEKVDV